MHGPGIEIERDGAVEDRLRRPGNAAATRRSYLGKSAARIASASARLMVIPALGAGGPAAAVWPTPIVHTPATSR